MKNLREYIKTAETQGVALGHFNVSNLETFHAIYAAAKKFNLPVIIGVSTGEEEFIGRDEIVALVKSIKEKDNYPIFLNADHHYTFDEVKGVLDAGFDAAIIDGVKLSLEENIVLTKKCVNYARELSQKENRDILIEAELGFIGTSSKVLEEIPDGVTSETMTQVADAKYFVEQTGIDLLAPSVGNIHGLIKGGNPQIDISRIKEIRNKVGIPLVLHGGSGISDNDFHLAIKAGISIVHINTELRIAYQNSLKEYLAKNPNEIAPYKILKPAVEAVQAVVEEKLKIFNHL